MCTIGYHKHLGLIFKNRDKSRYEQEVVILQPNFLAIKTEGASYYSFGINKNGCGFVSAAVNTPEWTTLVYAGRKKDADIQFQKDNEQLSNPMVIVSNLLPTIINIQEWISAIEKAKLLWMGYNLLIADRENAMLIELYDTQIYLSEIKDKIVVTNHFQKLNHGPKKRENYLNSFLRFEYCNELIDSANSIEDICQMLKLQNIVTDKDIWRKGTFQTISSSIIDLNSCTTYYTTDKNKNYYHIDSDITTTEWQKKHIEMSRYIDLQTYHKIERTHPFYIEMLDEIINQIKAFCPNCLENKNYNILEFGAGTGIFTSILSNYAFLNIDALELDAYCCEMLNKNRCDKNYCVICEDILSYSKEKYYDIVVSTFAHDHIHYNKRFELARNIKNNLRDGGIYVMGGEILSFFKNERERKKSLFLYHNYIINLALQDNHVELSEIENNALKSGLDMLGDFKRHELMFEEEMESSGMQLIMKKKIGPLDRNDVGGIFVYLYKV